MKKSLIALAALAAVSAASAQSSVSLSGLLDLGFRSVNAPDGYADTKGVIASGGSATTAIFIRGTEDLGAGLKASFQYEINPDFAGGTGLAGVGQGQSVSGSSVTTVDTSFTGANGNNFLGLSGGFGEVKVGRLNTGSLSAWGTASVFGTALGSGYGSAGQYVRYGSTATTAFNTAPTRFNNAFEYTSPSVAGFKARVLLVPKVDEAAAASACSTSSGVVCAGNTNVSSTATGNVNSAGVNRAGATDLSLAYAAGPLNVMVAQQKIKVGANGINALVGYGSAATTNSTHTLNTLAANYTIGAVKVQGGYWTEEQSTPTATSVDISGYIIGGKFTMGAIDLMASMARTNDKTTSNVDRKILGVGADYNLSKRTALWTRYETRDINSNVSADTALAGNTKTFAAGVRHAF